MHQTAEQSDEEKHHQGVCALNEHEQSMLQAIQEDIEGQLKKSSWVRRLRFGVKSSRFAITPEACKFGEQLQREGFKISNLNCGKGVTLELADKLLSLVRLDMRSKGYDVSKPIEHQPCEVDGINASYIEYTLTPRVA